MKTYVIIPTGGRDEVLECLRSVGGQNADITVITVLNGTESLRWGDERKWLDAEGRVRTVYVPDRSPDLNISRWWNIGINTANEKAEAEGITEYNILILNDDVVLPHHFIERLGYAMRETGATLAYPDQHGGKELILHTEPKPVDLRTRITGYAFMLRGEADLHLDESFVWWYGDDDLDWRARRRGGALLVPGIEVMHRSPNGWQRTHPELIEQTARDRAAFIVKWGHAPH